MTSPIGTDQIQSCVCAHIRLGYNVYQHRCPMLPQPASPRSPAQHTTLRATSGPCRFAPPQVPNVPPAIFAPPVPSVRLERLPPQSGALARRLPLPALPLQAGRHRLLLQCTNPDLRESLARETPILRRSDAGSPVRRAPCTVTGTRGSQPVYAAQHTVAMVPSVRRGRVDEQ
jgi:hypothetical protein